MKKLIQVFTIAAITALFTTASSFAQSSGNFTARVQTPQCTMNTAGGVPGSGGLAGGGGTLLTTYIKTPNSSQTTLLIRPSLVTGLFTNTEVTQAMPFSAQTAAVTVTVTLDNEPVAPATVTKPSIIYDQRFQQLSAPFFSQLAQCTANQNCSMDLIISTLAAHSFDFVRRMSAVAPMLSMSPGNSPAAMPRVICRPPTARRHTRQTAGACAGPGTVTVTQVKNFSQSAPIVIL